MLANYVDPHYASCQMGNVLYPVVNHHQILISNICQQTLLGNVVILWLLMKFFAGFFILNVSTNNNQNIWVPADKKLKTTL